MTTRYLTTVDVATELSCSRDFVLRAIRRGDLTAFVEGRLVRVTRQSLDAYIAARTTGDQLVQRRRRRMSA